MIAARFLKVPTGICRRFSERTADKSTVLQNGIAQVVANGGPKRQPNSVLVSATLKNDAIGSEKPYANALQLRDSVPISQ